MAFNTLWFWAFVLVTVAIPPLMAVKKDDSGSTKTTPRNAIWSWPIVFMHSKIIYLNASTKEYPGINCIKEYRGSWNRSARLLTKMMVSVFSFTHWTMNEMLYKAAGKRGPAQAFTVADISGSANYTIAFNYTSEYCAIIRKENKTGEVSNDACELWVNDKFFISGHEEQEACTTKFKTYCKSDNKTVFNIENCLDSVGKVLLIG
nr:uncharacterized protein LOC119163905 [Rhipicephalus microplus]